jgi:hypothetical protein
LTLAAGLAAALASWLMGEATQSWFAVTRVRGPGPPTIEEQRVARAELEASETKTAALAIGLLGGALGLAMGIAGGLVRGSLGAGAKAGLAGLAVGAGAGALAASAMMPIYFSLVDRDPLSRNALGIPLLIHICVWSPIGAAGGCAWGLGLGRNNVLPRAVLSGLLGALIGSIIYEFVGALVFPLAMTTRPISVTWGSRLLARLLVAGLAATGVAASLSARQPVGSLSVASLVL